MEKMNKRNKSILEILTPVVAIVSCIIGLASAILSLTLNKEIPVASLYWFVFALAVMIFPYIREIKFKDLAVTLEVLNSTQKDIRKISAEMTDTAAKISNTAGLLKKIDSFIDPTRKELIRGYQVYLNSIQDENEKMEKVKMLSEMYLSCIDLTVADIKKKLKLLEAYEGEVNNDFSKEYYESLKKYQEKKKLVPDGIFGFMTYWQLVKDEEQNMGNEMYTDKDH